ncbi:MAG: Rid family hydrolase [Thermogutta sp.]
MKKRWFQGIVIGALFPLLVGCPSSGTRTREGDQTPTAASPQQEEVKRAAKREWEPGVNRLGPATVPGTSSLVVVHQRPLLFTRQLNLEADGGGSAEGLIGKLFGILEAGGSNRNQLVRLNVYGVSAAEIEAFLAEWSKLFPAGGAPVVTALESPLPDAKEKLAIDAVAAVEANVDAVAVKSMIPEGNPTGAADYSVTPTKGLVFLSGRPEKGETAGAARAAIEGQLALAAELGCEPGDVVQIRVFLTEMEEAPTVLDAIRSALGEKPVPPVSFVAWIASAPVEIELTACHPQMAGDDSPSEVAIRFYNPADVKPSPNFSRATIVNSPTLIFTAGYLARSDADGTGQTRDVFSQLTEALESVGSDLRHGAKAHYFVSDDDASKAVDVLRKEYLDPGRPPAASKAKVHGLGRSGRGVCIDWISVPGDP